MKSKKAQMDLNPVAVLMAVLGAAFAFYLAGRMDAGFFLKLITALATGVVCYFIVIMLGNQ